jgi:thymidylate kinase
MDVGMDWLRGLTVDCQDIRKPDLCIFLDLEPEKSMERITTNRKSEDIEIYETLESLTDIRDRFYNVIYSLKNDNIEIIDASGTVEEVAKRIQHTVEMFFNN